MSCSATVDEMADSSASVYVVVVFFFLVADFKGKSVYYALVIVLG